MKFPPEEGGVVPIGVLILAFRTFLELPLEGLVSVHFEGVLVGEKCPLGLLLPADFVGVVV